MITPDLSPRQLRVADDRGEDIIEVMSQPACQLSDNFGPLSFAELNLQRGAPLFAGTLIGHVLPRNPQIPMCSHFDCLSSRCNQAELIISGV